MTNPVQKLRLLSRAEIILLRIHLRVLARQTVLYAVGVLLVLLTVAMLNVAMYATLAARYGSSIGAFVVALINAVLAVSVLLVASRIRPGPEAAIAEEARDLAMAEISADTERVRQGISDLKADVQRIRSGFGAFAGGGGSLASLLQLAPLLDLLIGALKRAKKR